MADDTSYNAFLTKANQDLSSSTKDKVQSTSQSRSKYDPTTPTSVQGGVPKSLTTIGKTYTSDTDSEFEPVFFSYAGGDKLPSLDDFKKCLGVKGQECKVEQLGVEEWDPMSEYGEVVTKVKMAGVDVNAGVRVFRVEIDKTRVEYYILTIGERKLVGVVAKAVES